tara:strand:- start:659 stop:1156 length:498 start_codon:yes stop_codon:yes gene_type:complete
MRNIKHTKSLSNWKAEGFSLIELIIIMTILGIMIAASTTRIKDITLNARISAAINQITTDIDQAKTISMGMRKQIRIVFDQNNETYTIYENGNLYNDFPGSNNGVVSLIDNNNSDVDITSVNFNGSNAITFTKWGNCLQSGTVILNNTRQIHIKNLTGHWEIINS